MSLVLRNPKGRDLTEIVFLEPCFDTLYIVFLMVNAFFSHLILGKK